ncbi:MAG: alpha-2-macroglobulin family protein, partial [Thermoguttaceae bacterium]
SDSQGRAEVRFDLPDSAMRLRAVADAVGGSRIGSAVETIVSRRPLQLSAQTPARLILGDRLEVPVTIAGQPDEDRQVQVTFEVGEELRPVGPTQQVATLDKNGRGSCLFSAEAARLADPASLRFHAERSESGELAERIVRIDAPGYPQEESLSGILKNEQPCAWQTPEDMVEGSLRAVLEIFPSPAAELQRGLESVGGLQLDSVLATIAVADLIVDYAKSHQTLDPEGLRRAGQRRSAAIERLGSFRDSRGGYGAMEGEPADVESTARAVEALVKDRDSFGIGSPRYESSVHWLVERLGMQGQTSEPASAATAGAGAARALWALAVAGEADLETLLETVAAAARRSQEGRQLALAALAAERLKRNDLAAELLEALKDRQGDGGEVADRPSGEATPADVETGGLAARAWATQPAYAGYAKRTIGWLRTQRDGSGDFGGPTATAAALAAIVAGEEVTDGAGDEASSGSESQATVARGDKVLAERSLEANGGKTIVIGGLEKELLAGGGELVARLSGTPPLPFTWSVRYHRLKRPADGANCGLRLQTELKQGKLDRGATTAIAVGLKNTGKEVVATAIVQLGLPAGLELAKGALQGEKQAGRLVAYELGPGWVMLYAAKLAPGAEAKWTLEVRGVHAGRYTGPASFAVPGRGAAGLGAGSRCWAEPLTVEIHTFDPSVFGGNKL